MTRHTNDFGNIDREIVLMRLYRIFRLPEEEYITSVKLYYIYDHLHKEVGDEVFVAITERLKDFKTRKKTERLNNYYHLLQENSLSRIAADRTARAPGTNERYIPGWKCG